MISPSGKKSVCPNENKILAFAIVAHANQFTDREVKVSPAFADAGLQAAAHRAPNDSAPIYEYAVSAVNGNGEGAKSLVPDTDPASWRNWTPQADLRFKRQSEFWRVPWVAPEAVPLPLYP